MRYKAGDETESIRDGVASLLIRSKIAVEVVEQVENVPTSEQVNDTDEQTGSGDSADAGTADTGRSEEAKLHRDKRHKPRHGTDKRDSSGS